MSVGVAGPVFVALESVFARQRKYSLTLDSQIKQKAYFILFSDILDTSLLLQRDVE